MDPAAQTQPRADAAPAPPPAPAPPLRRVADLPGPKGIPLLGNALQIAPERFHLQLEQWARDFGPYYRLKLGKEIAVVVGDHEAVAAVLRDRPHGFRRTPRVREVGLEMGLLPSLFGAEGDDWQRQRRMVMASFDPGHVKRYFPALAGVADRLAGRWAKAATAGADIDLQADLMRYTVDTIAGLAFGSAVNTLESDGDVIQQHLDKIFPALQKRMFALVPTWRLVRSAADKRLAHSVAEVRAAVDGFVAQARARLLADPGLLEKPRNLLEAMLAAADQPGSGINDDNVAGNVFGMLLAGEDTTANTLAWMIHLLWRNPLALARATEEVRRVLGDGSGGSGSGGAITLAQMDKLDYVEACASETMRLKPVAPINSVQALRDTVVGDVQVRAGMLVMCLTRRDSVADRHVAQADQFQPERWLPGATGAAAQMSAGARRTSMPFGAGPRICPGRYLALLEMKVAIATLLNRFEVDSVHTADGLAPVERLAFTMTPVGLRLRLRLRAPTGRVPLPAG